LPGRWSPAAKGAFGVVLAGCGLLGLALGPAFADNAVVPDLPAQLGLRGSVDVPLQLEVYINGRTRKIIAEFRRLADGAFTATHSELSDSGIKPPDGPRDGTVKLDDIKGLRYRYDESKQAIFFEAPDTLIEPQTYFASRSVTAGGDATSDWGAAINYDAFGTTSQWAMGRRLTFGGASLLLDGRGFSPIGVLNQSGILGTTAFNTSSALRLDTSWQYLDDARQISYRAGDAITSGLPWTRPIRLGGIQVQRDFALRPDLVTSPTPTASGTAAVPSSVDVYVNNFKVFTQDVEPGPFVIQGLPTINSNGTTSVVLHDVTGKEVTQTLPFFVSSRLLNHGIIDYSFEAGYSRTYYGVDSFSYGPDPIASASLRGGLNDWLTVETHAEGGAGLVNGGAGLVLNAFNRGVVQGALASSHFGGGNGFQIAFGGTTAIGDVVIDVSTQRTFGNYADLAMITTPTNNSGTTFANLLHIGAVQTTNWPLALVTSIEPPKALDRISISLPRIFNVDVGFTASFVNYVQSDGQKSRITSVGLSKSFHNGATVFANAYVDEANHNDAGVFVGFSMALGDSTSVSAGANAQRIGTTYSSEIARSGGPDPGSYGWRVYDNEGVNRFSAAEATYQSQYGRASVAAAEYGWNKSAAASSSADVAGSVSALGGSVKLGPTISDALVLVNAGAPGVTVLEDNRAIGVTDRFGQLLVPGLRGFQDNKIAIDPNTLPLTAQVLQTEAIVTPKTRSGVVVDFKVAASAHDAEIILKDSSGAFIPAGARTEMMQGKGAAMVGYDGRLYLTDLSPHNQVSVRTDRTSCTAEFDYSAAKDAVRPTIGPVICK
jgi:outer membrane usher protein